MSKNKTLYPLLLRYRLFVLNVTLVRLKSAHFTPERDDEPLRPRFRESCRADSWGDLKEVEARINCDCCYC